MPHSDSGFSPFDLVYGFRVRTPLDALYHGLFEVDSEKLNVCEWVSNMAERLELMRDCAAVKMMKGKESRLMLMNRGTKLREFEVGSKVLYRIPGLNCKLADSWEGPYIVLERTGEVNYKIHKEGAKKHCKVVHVNCLKKYCDRESVCRLDVVVEDDYVQRNKLSGVCVDYNQVELDKLLGEYEGVFSDLPGSTKRVVMNIETGDHQPVRQAPYSVPLGIRDEVRNELSGLEKCGVIERCESQWASPLVPVRKQGGGVRLCVDYRKLNEITVKEPYYIPGFEEMVEMVGKGRVLSKVDLSKGFHQVEVLEEDRDKTCFVCPFGKFRFRRMPFGLTNAPSVFQRLMDLVLVDCVDFARVYIDDILVVSGCWSEHLVHLGRLFEALKEAGLTCKRSCFGKVRLEFLGHVVGGRVINVPETRVRAIREHPLPKTRKQLRAFLGLVGYYRRFIRNYHSWSSSLTPSTSRNAAGTVEWSSQMMEAFHGLCKSLCHSVCLVVPCVSDVFVLECDASVSGVGAVLSVVRGEEHLPVAFFSKQLKGAHQRYSAQKLEGLALFEAVRHFAFYLYGKEFTVVTDHRSLVTLMMTRQLNRRLYNWALKLTEFKFKVVCHSGRENGVADCLSRCHTSAEGGGGRCGHTHMKKEEQGTCVCVCVNINCLCCSMRTAIDCVVMCSHNLFVSVVLINVGMLYACVHVCSRAGTLQPFV